MQAGISRLQPETLILADARKALFRPTHYDFVVF
jgi:hypothetical protein